MSNSVLALIANPPYWILAVLIVIAVSHVMQIALKIPPGGLIPTLESLGTVVLAALSLHVYLESSFYERHQQSVAMTSLPFVLVIFVLLSVVFYMINKKLE